MRDRLIELILQAENKADENGFVNCNLKSRRKAEFVAGHLLAEGVIVPKVKVGDVVYIPDDFGRIDAEIERIEITERGLCYEWVKYDRGVDETEVWDDGSFEDADIGKTVFLSFEDFEKALKEREGEG